jgi:hypothetical protein
LNIDVVPEGEEGYCLSELLPKKGIRQRWSLHGNVRSVQWRASPRGVVKARNGFTDHLDPEDLAVMLSDGREAGVIRPSSYGDFFHQRIKQPRCPKWSRKMFPQVPGGWQAVLGNNSVCKKPLWQYDIRSAYLWSLMQGLPHPDSFERVKKVAGPGLYWCESPALPMLPYPWNHPGIYPATEDELLALPLNHQSVTSGIIYKPGGMPVQEWARDIRQWDHWKAVARSYWGRWASIASPVCETLLESGEVNTRRELPDPSKNPIWGAIITSRVRLRLWQIADKPGTHRVFVDSVVTEFPIETGGEIGDWVEKAHFPKGGEIHITGVLAA